MLEIENIMFIQPCFIRKNTPKLRKQLEELGYLPSNKMWYDENFAICTIYRDNTSGYFNAKIDDDFEKIIAPSYSYIDCGTNEELFLALASLRDDTSINQYYWFNGRLFKCESLEFDRVLENNTANHLLRCRCVDKPMILSCFKERNLKKATVEELIDYFNK